MAVVFDIYNKKGMFRKRTKVQYEGREAFVPTEQFEVFKELCQCHPQVSKEINQDGNLYLEGLSDDITVKVLWEQDTLCFCVERTQRYPLGVIEIH